MVGKVEEFRESIVSLRRQLSGGPSVREELFSHQDKDPFEVNRVF